MSNASVLAHAQSLPGARAGHPAHGPENCASLRARIFYEVVAHAVGVEVLDRYKRQIGNPLTGAWSTGAMAMLTRNSASAKIDKDLGAKLRAFRLAAGLTQSELGDFLGISHTQMMKYELGKNRMAVSTLVQLCWCLS